MDLDEIRRLAVQAQQREEQEQREKTRAHEEEMRRLVVKQNVELNRRIDAAIAGVPEKVKQCASWGGRDTTVFDFTVSDLICSSRYKRKGVFRSEDYAAGYEPDCLPPELRRLYDWCERSGFKTEIHTGQHDCWIKIRW